MSFLPQTEIAKRLNAILAQIMPFLSQEVSVTAFGSILRLRQDIARGYHAGVTKPNMCLNLPTSFTSSPFAFLSIRVSPVCKHVHLVNIIQLCVFICDQLFVGIRLIRFLCPVASTAGGSGC